MKNTYTIYRKGNHEIKVKEVGLKGYIERLGGMDSTELMEMLIENGYTILGQAVLNYNK